MTSSIDFYLIISAIDRTFSIGDDGMDCTFEAMIVGEKGTSATRDLVHDFGAGKYRLSACPDTPQTQCYQ